MGDSLCDQPPGGSSSVQAQYGSPAESAGPPGSAAAVAGGAAASETAAATERTRNIIYFLTVVWFVPLIMWFPAYTQYVLQRRCKALMETGEVEGCDNAAVSASGKSQAICRCLRLRL